MALTCKLLVELRGFEPLTPSMRTTGGAVDRGRCGGSLGSEGRSRPCWIASAAALSCCTAPSSRRQVGELGLGTLHLRFTIRGRPALMATGVITHLVTHVLAVWVVPVPEESPLRPVERGPPGLLAAWTVANDLDMAVACAPGGGTVARLPGDRDGARLPRVVQAALGRPGHSDHLAR